MDEEKRIAVFAHYDKNNLIQDYVVYYLKELKKFAEKIIFVSDCDLSEKELLKISDITEATIAKKHGEYDFGSYKRGYFYAKENNLLPDYEELIFCNDSCYAPLFDFKNIFNAMENKSLDFWGNTLNKIGGQKNEHDLHIQSYFIVFCKKVFTSDIFNQFMLSIKKEKSKKDVIKNYEIGLSHILSEHGFKFDVYCNKSKEIETSHVYGYKELIKNDKSPFVKTCIYRNRYIKKNIFPDYNIIKKNCSFDINLIKEDLKYNLYDTILNIKYKDLCHRYRKLFFLLSHPDKLFLF